MSVVYLEGGGLCKNALTLWAKEKEKSLFLLLWLNSLGRFLNFIL